MTWDSFFSAEVGAAAALAGLIFVGISINLQRILGLPMIARRAFQALLVLLGILAVVSILLVPGLTGADAGASVLVVAVLLLLTLDIIEVNNWRGAETKIRRLLFQHTVEIQLPPALMVLGGASLVVGNPWALYWFLPATLLSFLVALIEAWVITVEILR